MPENKNTLIKNVDFSSLHIPCMEDRQWVNELLEYPQYMGCEHAFGTIFMWSCAYETRIMRIGDFLIARGKKSFSMPAGYGDMGELLNILKDWCEETDQPFAFHGVTADMIPTFEQLMPGYFKFTPIRDAFDYIYLTERLIGLSGKKLHGKRNHISKFSREYDWSYEDITADNLDECVEVSKRWCQQHSEDCSNGNNSEMCALDRAVSNYFELEFEGGLIRVDGNVVAFTCGERLNRDTFDIHFEKTLPGWESAYPVINNEFAKNRLSGYKYINREEDLGLEGLRKAKLSYHPDILLEKYLATPVKPQ